jgi:hypothetical protein
MKKYLNFDNFMYFSIILVTMLILILLYDLGHEINTTDWQKVVNGVQDQNDFEKGN